MPPTPRFCCTRATSVIDSPAGISSGDGRDQSSAAAASVEYVRTGMTTRLTMSAMGSDHASDVTGVSVVAGVTPGPVNTFTGVPSRLRAAWASRLIRPSRPSWMNPSSVCSRSCSARRPCRRSTSQRGMTVGPASVPRHRSGSSAESNTAPAAFATVISSVRATSTVLRCRRLSAPSARRRMRRCPERSSGLGSSRRPPHSCSYSPLDSTDSRTARPPTTFPNRMDSRLNRSYR